MVARLAPGLPVRSGSLASSAPAGWAGRCLRALRSALPVASLGAQAHSAGRLARPGRRRVPGRVGGVRERPPSIEGARAEYRRCGWLSVAVGGALSAVIREPVVPMNTITEFERNVVVGGAAREHTDGEGEDSWDPRPSVEQAVQARIDYGGVVEDGGRVVGQTLVAEERMRGRAWEIERTRARRDRSQSSRREVRSREGVGEWCRSKRRVFAERRGSVDRWAHPDEPDAREQLEREELARVNRAARRLSERVGGWTPAAVSRLVAERVVETGDVATAVLLTFERLQVDPGGVVPIGRLGEVQSGEVSVEGRVVTLWDPSHPTIAQVGLIADETGRTKFTSWRQSNQPVVSAGERVRVVDAAKSWYEGRCSIAFTRRTRVEIESA